MAEEKKLDIDPKVQRFINSVYPSNLKCKSKEELAKSLITFFDDKIDWVSTSYHVKKSDLTQKSGKQEVYEYYLLIFSSFNAVGCTTNIEEMNINGLCGTVRSKFAFIDDKDQVIGDEGSAEASFELNQNGKCVRWTSISKDYDIAKLTRKEYLFKSIITDNKDKTKVTITCLDCDFNKIKLQMDRKDESEKLRQINRIVKEGETKKKDVMIVVVEPQTKSGQITTIVSHAILG
eukprot:547083_1